MTFYTNCSKSNATAINSVAESDKTSAVPELLKDSTFSAILYLFVFVALAIVLSEQVRFTDSNYAFHISDFPLLYEETVYSKVQRP